MRPSIVVVRSENRVIGVANKLPWHQREDLKYFKRVTLGHHVIMGRNTYDSVGRPLPERVNIVVTRAQCDFPPGVLVARTVAEALEMCSTDPEPMIVGGAQIYVQLLPFTRRIYETVLHVELEGEAFFPAIDPAAWKLTSESERFPADARNDHDYTFRILDRVEWRGVTGMEAPL